MILSVEDIVSILKDGGLAAVFLWLYLSERKAHNDTRNERLSDMKQGLDSLHKSISVLDEARTDVLRRDRG